MAQHKPLPHYVIENEPKHNCLETLRGCQACEYFLIYLRAEKILTS